MAEVAGDVAPLKAAAETAGGNAMANFLGVDPGADSSALGMSASTSVKGASCSTSADLSSCKPVELTAEDVQTLLHAQASSSGGLGSDMMMTQSLGSDVELGTTTTAASTVNQPAVKGEHKVFFNCACRKSKTEMTACVQGNKSKHTVPLLLYSGHSQQADYY